LSAACGRQTLSSKPRHLGCLVTNLGV
jgi:hypothetical protein